MSRCLLAALAVWLATPALADQNIAGMPRAMDPGRKTAYWVWLTKPGRVKIHVRWTADSIAAKRFHGSIESESLWAEADRIQAGKAATAVRITDGGSSVEWDTNTGKWIDGFDASLPDTEWLYFKFNIDGQPADPLRIYLGKIECPAKRASFYWVSKPPEKTWPDANGLAAKVKPTEKPSLWIGVDKDGTWVVRVAAKGSDPANFLGTISARQWRMEQVMGLDGKPDKRATKAALNRAEFGIKVQNKVDGFRFRTGAGAKRLQFELSINGKDVKADQVFLGKEGKHPESADPLWFKRAESKTGEKPKCTTLEPTPAKTAPATAPVTPPLAPVAPQPPATTEPQPAAQPQPAPEAQPAPQPTQ